MSGAPLKRAVDPQTRARQSRAADPRVSAWVTANAGSGKTHVLTQRVIRLLLDGVDPSKILCLTFTKAAAANMATRVFRTLARWTTLSDEALLEEIYATGVERMGDGGLAFARKLFARTVETPGGLKIQTIHAFCERLLHLFPFEANAPAGFRVLDDREAGGLMNDARASAIEAAENDPELASAIATIAKAAGADGFDALLDEVLQSRAEIEAFGGAEAYGEQLSARLGLKADDTEAAIRRRMCEDGGGASQWRAWARKLYDSTKTTDRKRAADFSAAAASTDETLQIDLLIDALFNKDGTATQRLTTKELEKLHPSLDGELHDEQDRLLALIELGHSAKALERSLALVRVAEAALKTYQRLKNASGALDFADLVERALALVTKADAAWVLYKLDKGIEHFLVDEAQDTSRAQWEILERLAEEFLSGAGASRAARSFFAVGDEKQSIYSFQGAEPALFSEMRRNFERRHKAVDRRFEPVQLNLSFRSAPKLLAAVDAVFSLEQAWRGVSAIEPKAPTHAAHHRELQGVVELWETLKPAEAPDPEDWSLPLDAQSARDPRVKLAERIADQIADLTSPASSERVVDASTGLARRIRPHDILILVRSRGPFYEAMTRALRRRRLDFAGADRLRLSEHIAVLDLISAGRAALCPDDDLALAEALKSPLMGFDDEALIALAPGRPGSLADALATSSGKGHPEAAALLGTWRRRAVSMSPFDFYARLLSADEGRKKLLARLGAEAADAIDEFLAAALAFEAGTSPSLSAFLDEVTASENEIKRESETEAGGVRVMTVHAAKGLEAPIVFLPDTLGKAQPAREPKWLAFEPTSEGEAKLRIWASRKGEDSPPLRAAREAAGAQAEGEHRRLLYVAMTRAAQRLVVAGAQGALEPPADCWHRLIHAGLAQLLTPAQAPWSAEEQIWRYADAPPPSEAIGTSEAPPASEPPAWLAAKPAQERTEPVLAPSRAAPRRYEGASERRRESREAGRLAHALMEKLPELAQDLRPAGAARIAQNFSLEAAQRAEIAEHALLLLERPSLAHLFGPHSRGEVAVTGWIEREGAAPAPVSGRIDRLAVFPDRVELIDFKSGKGGRSAYVTQLALYVAALQPVYDKPVCASILWLSDGDLERISASEIDTALGNLMSPKTAAP